MGVSRGYVYIHVCMYLFRQVRTFKQVCTTGAISMDIDMLIRFLSSIRIAYNMHAVVGPQQSYLDP